MKNNGAQKIKIVPEHYTSVTTWITQRIKEIEPEEIGRKASTPKAVKSLAYIQKSLFI